MRIHACVYVRVCYVVHTQDRFGSLFFCILYLALMGLSSLPIWADDRLLFLRERAAGAYGTSAYFTAVSIGMQ